MAKPYTCRQTFRLAGRRIHFTHAGRHSGMEADGYTYTCRQTFRHAGRWLHMYMYADMQAWRQVVTHAGRHSIMETVGFTWRPMAIHGGR